MAAMRLYEPREMEAMLKSHGCIATDITSDTAIYWYTKSKVLFAVPEPDSISGKYSDFVYYQVQQFVKDN